MDTKQIVYFIARSENVPRVLQESIDRVGEGQKVTIFFDLDGTRALDEHYAKQISLNQNVNLPGLFKKAVEADIKMYVCQMNVMESCQLHCAARVESAGVVTFLEYGYQADAIFSY